MAYLKCRNCGVDEVQVPWRSIQDSSGLYPGRVGGTMRNLPQACLRTLLQIVRYGLNNGSRRWYARAAVCYCFLQMSYRVLL